MKAFIKDSKEYTRDLNILSHYIKDQTFYLHKLTGESLAKCEAFVKHNISAKGYRPLKMPMVAMLERDKNQDRQKVTKPLINVLQDIQSKKEILTPSLTAYCNQDVALSSLASYVEANKVARNILKKKKFEAVMAGNGPLADMYESGQTTKKIKNNALSGAQSSPYTILWNKTAHSSLTSTCRSATSYGNANNERFIMGNRHYWSPDIALNNLVSLVTHTDMNQVEKVMGKYNLSPVNKEAVMDMVKRSTRLYWRNPKHLQLIEDYIDKLNPIELSFVLLNSNLFDLANSNPQFTFNLINNLSTKVTTPSDLKWLELMDDDLKAYVCMLFADEMKGRSYNKVKETDSSLLGLIAGQIEHVISTIDYYSDFIRVFWTNDHLPPSIYNMPTMIRKAVIVSDTDSTIFTVSYWIDRMRQLGSTAVPDAIANTIVFLCGQCVRNIMARLSGNLGTHVSEIPRLVMKNEFYFPVFALTGRAKHYFAYRSAQEGNVFTEPQLEIKGVGLRNSNIPNEFNDKAQDLMRYILDTARQGNSLSLNDILGKIAEVEKDALELINKGDYRVMRSVQIKDSSAYKEGDKNPTYFHYLLWQHAFSLKYGDAPTLPYRAVKLSVTTTSTNKLNKWLEEMQDVYLASRIRGVIDNSLRKNLTTIYLPEDIVNQKGIPLEIKSILDSRTMLAQLMETFYIILDTLGYAIKNDNNTRLVIDEVNS